jgi:hypothetical protein
MGDRTAKRSDLPVDMQRTLAAVEAELTEELRALGYDGVTVEWNDEPIGPREVQ